LYYFSIIKNIKYFDYLFEIAGCKNLIDSNDILLTSKTSNDRFFVLAYYFGTLEKRLVDSKHISYEFFQKLRSKYLAEDIYGKQCLYSGTYREDSQLRIAVILYLRIISATIEETGRASRVGFAAMKNLGEQASYLTDIIRAISIDAQINKDIDDLLKMLSLSLFYRLHLNALGLCDLDSIGAANYKQIGLLAKCVELMENIKKNKNDPWITLKKRSLKDNYNQLPDNLKDALQEGYGEIL